MIRSIEAAAIVHPALPGANCNVQTSNRHG